MGAVSGLDELGQLIEHVATDLRRTTSQAARESAARTLARALTLVPTDEGELAASGRVVSRPDGFAVVFDAPHALIVHQSPDLRHDDGQWQYLAAAVEPDEFSRLISERA